MKEAFKMGTDFSGMVGKEAVFIQGVFHQALVSAVQAGTEAAAVTAVI